MLACQRATFGRDLSPCTEISLLAYILPLQQHYIPIMAALLHLALPNALFDRSSVPTSPFWGVHE